MARDTPRGARLTREGQVLALLTVALLGAAWISGNNVVALVVSGLGALWLLDAVLGGWNLRHLEIRREVPAEVFAEVAARGAFRIRNARRWLPSAAVRLEDGAGATATLDRLPPGAEVAVPTGWTFPGRGSARLGALRVGSAFPFGLWWRWRSEARPAEILVYPRPRVSEPTVAPGSAGEAGRAEAGRGAMGDVDDLRGYRDGDPPRRIHWPTSARREQPVVVLRTEEQADRVMVRVRDLHGRAWEHEISRAAGEVLRAFRRGCRVGLELPEARLEARGGPTWRRTLLEALARQPERGP